MATLTEVLEGFKSNLSEILVNDEFKALNQKYNSYKITGNGTVKLFDMYKGEQGAYKIKVTFPSVHASGAPTCGNESPWISIRTNGAEVQVWCSYGAGHKCKGHRNIPVENGFSRKELLVDLVNAIKESIHEYEGATRSEAQAFANFYSGWKNPD